MPHKGNSGVDEGGLQAAFRKPAAKKKGASVGKPASKSKAASDSALGKAGAKGAEALRATVARARAKKR